jgi:hypothetical protein
MDEISSDTPARWKTCVSTIKCDAIGDYISVMVKNDWTSVCTWYRQNRDVVSEDKRKVSPDRKVRKKIPLCQGPLCSYVTGYRDRLISEEREVKS